MNCVELEELCNAALNKIGLRLVPLHNKTGWKINPIEHNIGYIDYVCNGYYFIANAYSIEEVANMLFNLYDKETNALFWDIFCYTDENGNYHQIKNIFAGKTLDEAQIMVDLM